MVASLRLIHFNRNVEPNEETELRRKMGTDSWRAG